MTLICWITYRCTTDVGKKTAQQAARTCGTEGFWGNWSGVNMLFVQRGRNALIGSRMPDGFSVPSTQTSNSLKYLSTASVHQATATLRLMFPRSFRNGDLFTRVNKCGSCFQRSGAVESFGAAETVVVQLLMSFSSGSVCGDMNSSSIPAGSSAPGPHSSTSVH